VPRDILNDTLRTKLQGTNLYVADLIELQLTTTQYLTSAEFDLQFDSATAPDSGNNTYLAQGQFMNYSDIKETSDLRVATVNLEFTAVDLTTVALLMNNDFIDKRVVIYSVVMDADHTWTTNIIPSTNAYMLFDGRISGYGINQTHGGAVIELQAASQFADFEKVKGRRTNNESQQIHFPGDRGFEYAPQVIKDLKWGDM